MCSEVSSAIKECVSVFVCVYINMHTYTKREKGEIKFLVPKRYKKIELFKGIQ